MKYLMTLLIVFLVIQGYVAPPVTNEKEEEAEENEFIDPKELNLEYERYQEQENEVSGDKNLYKTIKEKIEIDIKSGKIDHELFLKNPNGRTKLEELQRIEIEALRQNTKEHRETDKIVQDLEKIDRIRRKRFKEYEMHKNLEKEEKMNNMTEEEKNKYMEEQKKLNEHEPLHHPGSRKQFEEVWKNEDKLEEQDFNLKVFFKNHDLDGNSFWDQEEVNVVLNSELDKLYENVTNYDFIERIEHLERMREHVFNEIDLNKDRLISLEELFIQSRKSEFEDDSGWPIDENSVYSQQEYETYKQQNAMRMSPEHASQLDAHQEFPPHPNEIHQLPDDYQHMQQPHYPQGQYPGQIPQQHPGHPQYGHVPEKPQQYHPNDVNYIQPQQNLNPSQHLPVGSVPPPHYQQPNVELNQQHHQQPPQQQLHQQPHQQPPQQQFHQQPSQQKFHQQPPQQQFHQQPSQQQFHQQQLHQQPQQQFHQQPPQQQFHQQPPQQQFHQQPPQQQFHQQPPQQQFHQQPPQQQLQQQHPSPNPVSQQQKPNPPQNQPPVDSNNVKPPPQKQQQ